MDRLIFVLIASVTLLAGAERVLIVADEIPAMEALAGQFKMRIGTESRIVTQAEMPASLDPYSAVVVYVHRELFEGPEKAILEYVRGGRKAILIHHSISSGKRKNRDWFRAFAITLPTGKLEDGGYGYYAPATFEMVNLAPSHPVTTKGVRYQKKTDYAAGGVGAPKSLDAFEVPASEIFLNHQFNGERTKLLGVKWTDPRSNRNYQQDTGGWLMRVGKGSVFYFMAGHRIEDMSIDPYAQILSNALRFKK
jgi:hypothetical protein